MKNSTSFLETCQRNLEKILSKPGFSSLNVEQLVTSINSLSYYQRRILNKFLKYFAYYKTVDPSQITLSEEVGCCSKTVWRATEILEAIGFMSKRQRYNTSCEYTLNPVFFDYEIRSILLPLLSSLKVIPLMWLLSCFRQGNFDVTNRNVQLTNINIKFGNHYTNGNGILLSTENEEKHREVKKLVKVTTMEAQKKRDLLKAFQETGKWDEDPITDTIKNIKNIVLTQEGKLKVGVFEDYIIQETDAALGRVTKHLEDPFGWFMKVANESSKLAKISVDWWWWKGWEEALAIADSALMFDKDKTLALKREKRSQPVRPAAAWKHNDRVQESLEWQLKKYELQLNLFNKGLYFEGLTFGELQDIRRGAVKGTPLIKPANPPTPPSALAREAIAKELEDAQFAAHQVETNLHLARGTDKYSKQAYTTPNIFFNKLTQEQGQEILDQVHVGCICRREMKMPQFLKKAMSYE